MSGIKVRRGIAPFLALNIAMLIAVVMAFTTLMDLRRERSNFQKELEAYGLALADALKDSLAAPLSSQDVASLDSLSRTVLSNRNVEYLHVFSRDGNIIVPQNGDASASEFAQNSVNDSEVVQRIKGETLEFASPVELDGTVIGGVAYGFDLEGVSARTNILLLQRIWQTLALMVAGLVVSFIMGQYFIQPLNGIRRVARKIAEGDYGKAEIKHRSDEIGDVSAVLADAVEKLNSRDQAREKSNSDNSQEIASLNDKLRSETAKRSKMEKAMIGLNESLEKERFERKEESKAADERLRQEIRERTSLQEELQKANAAGHIGQVARKVAHDVNNLLTPISGHTQLAMQKLPEDNKLQNNLKQISDATERASKLLGRLLDQPGEIPSIAQEEQPTAEPQPIKFRAADLPARGGTILVVDDEPNARVLSVGLLRELGYSVIEANTGVEAMRLARMHFGTPIALMITDVVMPFMNGRELVEQFLEIHPETKVVYASGYNAEALVNRGALDANAVFLQKPFMAEALLYKMHQAFNPPPPDEDEQERTLWESAGR